MKKIISILSLIAIVFTSCSNDENQSPVIVSSTLVKKIANIKGDNVVYSENITYDGNKIISITNENGYETKYYYTGNLITKQEEIDANGKLDITTNFIYAEEKLITSIIRKEGLLNYDKIEYVYNLDETISYKRVSINSQTEVQYYTVREGKLTFKNGNLIKDEYFQGIEHTIIFEYDNKNNPKKNIIGFEAPLNVENYEGSVNNMKKLTHISGSVGNIHVYKVTYNYKYDKNDFPTEKIAIGDDSTEIAQYIY